jgi:hypothetical protein
MGNPQLVDSNQLSKKLRWAIVPRFPHRFRFEANRRQDSPECAKEISADSGIEQASFLEFSSYLFVAGPQVQTDRYKKSVTSSRSTSLLSTEWQAFS